MNDRLRRTFLDRPKGTNMRYACVYALRPAGSATETGDTTAGLLDRRYRTCRSDLSIRQEEHS
jgi:hypothetical protein